MNEQQTRAQQLMGDIAPKLAELTDDVLFGDVWKRPGLTSRDRSLITVAALVALHRTDQVESHIRRALDNGLTVKELAETITHLAFYAGWPCAVSAAVTLRRCVDDHATRPAPEHVRQEPRRAEGVERHGEVLKRSRSSKGSAERFTGDVWVDMIAEGREPSRLRVGLVRFSPGARTAWHRHAVGQTLHVTEGNCLVQARGGAVIALRPGDTVSTPPGEWHWHGTAPEHFMAHLAMSESAGDPAVPDVEWGDHVTDGDFQKAAQLDPHAGGTQ